MDGGSSLATSSISFNSRSYGSLGAAIGFMTWLWISSIAVLIGAEVDAAMERRSFPDASAALELN